MLIPKPKQKTQSIELTESQKVATQFLPKEQIEKFSTFPQRFPQSICTKSTMYFLQYSLLTNTCSINLCNLTRTLVRVRHFDENICSINFHILPAFVQYAQ